MRAEEREVTFMGPLTKIVVSNLLALMVRLVHELVGRP